MIKTAKGLILSALAFVFLSMPAVRGEGDRALGPKDGHDLPPADLDRIKVGEVAPDFTLEDHNGSVVTLSDFRGKKGVILVFYRGKW